MTIKSHARQIRSEARDVLVRDVLKHVGVDLNSELSLLVESFWKHDSEFESLGSNGGCRVCSASQKFTGVHDLGIVLRIVVSGVDCVDDNVRYRNLSSSYKKRTLVQIEPG